MKRPSLRILLLCCLVACSKVEAAEPSAIQQYEKVTGGQLSITIQAGGAQVHYSAGGFYEWAQPADSNGERVRHLFASRFHAETTGSMEATYSSIPVDYGNGWAESTLVRLLLNQELDAKDLNPDVITPISVSRADTEALTPEATVWAGKAEQHHIAAIRSPVHILIREYAEGAPTCEIRVSPSLLGQLPKSETQLLETLTFQEMNEGQVLEKRDPTVSKPAPPLPTVHLGAGVQDAELTHSNLRPPRLSITDPHLRTIEITEPRGLSTSGSLKLLSRAEVMEGTQDGFGDTEIGIVWEFATGKPPDVGWVEVNERNAGSWLPDYGSELQFSVNLKRPKMVEAIRFVLSNVSRHPGIAANMGWAKDAPGELRSLIVPVKLETDEAELRWTREYAAHASLPEDDLPDLYFDPDENAGFELETGYELPSFGNQVVSQQLSTRIVGRKTTAKVSIGDWGASGQLQAEVLMNGFWERLEARGDLKGEDGVSLEIPLDRNKNGIADAFEGNASSDGDQLSLTEEYRGVYGEGEHRRLDPRKRDVFLIDYVHQLDRERRTLQELFAPLNIQLHFLRHKEHRAELIGSQRVLVLEDLRDHAFPAILAVPVEQQAEAWRTLAPTPSSSTLFLDESVPANYLARDLATMLGVSLPESSTPKTP